MDVSNSGAPLRLLGIHRQRQHHQERPMQRITPFLWFDGQAEEAATFYTGIFPNSRIVTKTHFGSAGPGPEGSVMTVVFELDGQEFIALNGGPHFKFTEAISFVVNCDAQEEVDTLWNALSAGGEEVQCGWLKDRYGLSWQVVPQILGELMNDPDRGKSERVMKALLKMTKIDIEGLKEAAQPNP
jgi:predicted 3-demethylubiquinone-9 3-methyltransferase (glyoxalase superfamily)